MSLRQLAACSSLSAMPVTRTRNLAVGARATAALALMDNFFRGVKMQHKTILLRCLKLFSQGKFQGSKSALQIRMKLRRSRKERCRQHERKSGEIQFTYRDVLRQQTKQYNRPACWIFLQISFVLSFTWLLCSPVHYSPRFLTGAILTATSSPATVGCAAR